MEERSQNNKFIKRRIVLLVILLLAIALISLIIYFGYKGYEKLKYKPYYEIEDRNEKIKTTKLHDAKTYAWLRVQGTDIDTPIATLTSTLDKDINADYLWTSSFYKEGDNRKVIYGHNVRNVSSYPDITNPEHFRFEQLVSFVYHDFAKENLYIQYNDGLEDKLYKIYAVTFNNESNEYGQSYKKEELNDYIEKVRKESIYDYDIEVDKTDELISLITCTRYFGVYEKTQFKVDARLVRKNEKIDKYNVETNSNYDIIK